MSRGCIIPIGGAEAKVHDASVLRRFVKVCGGSDARIAVIATASLGLGGIGSLEELANLKSVVVEVARNTAVLNADDPLCRKMAERVRARHLCWMTMGWEDPGVGVGRDPDHDRDEVRDRVRDHIRAGGRAAVLEKGFLTVYDQGVRLPLVEARKIPAALDGLARHNVANALAAAAIAFSLGLDPEPIRCGLERFGSVPSHNPGRLTVVDHLPFRVVLDYGHNPAAVRAMVELVSRMRVPGIRSVVLTAPGDRRDEDIEAIARAAAGRFDRYICRRDDDLRGRGPEQVPQLLARALLAARVDPSAITIEPEEAIAVEHALGAADDGDLVLLFVADVERTLEQVNGWRPPARPAPPAETSVPLEASL